MNITKSIQETSKEILDIINNSELHPSISKLILLDIVHNIEKYEFSLYEENNKE